MLVACEVRVYKVGPTGSSKVLVLVVRVVLGMTNFHA